MSQHIANIIMDVLTIVMNLVFIGCFIWFILEMRQSKKDKTITINCRDHEEDDSSVAEYNSRVEEYNSRVGKDNKKRFKL